MKTLLRTAAVTAVLLAVMSVLPACRSAGTGTPAHIQESFDFGSIKKVAVLPFENLTAEKSAGEAVRQVLINELLVSGLVDVAVPGDAVTAMEKAAIRNTTSLSADQMKTLANTLKVQALVFGSVERYGEIRVGSFSAPEVTVTIMMADVSSGSIVWSVTKTETGDSFGARHFGARSDSLSETLIRVVREAVRTLTRYQ